MNLYVDYIPKRDCSSYLKSKEDESHWEKETVSWSLENILKKRIYFSAIHTKQTIFDMTAHYSIVLAKLKIRLITFSV